MRNDFKRLNERMDRAIVVVKEAALIWDQAIEEQDCLSKSIKNQYEHVMAPMETNSDASKGRLLSGMKKQKMSMLEKAALTDKFYKKKSRKYVKGFIENSDMLNSFRVSYH